MGGETDELDKRLTAHEAVCAERWGSVLARVGRIEKILITGTGALLVGMAGMILALMGLK